MEDDDEDDYERDPEYDDETPEEWQRKCCFPGECCMPGEHYAHECHTAEMLEAYEEDEVNAARVEAAERVMTRVLAVIVGILAIPIVGLLIAYLKIILWRRHS